MVDLGIEPEWIPVVSGFVGAGGAVGAQIVSAGFTGRRETKAVKRREEEVKALAFREEKQESFLRVLRVFRRQIQAYAEMQDKIKGGTLNDVSLPTGTFLADEWDEFANEIDLYAPELTSQVNLAMRRFRNLDYSVATKNLEDVTSRLNDLRELRSSLRDEMRTMLGMDDLDSRMDVQPPTRRRPLELIRNRLTRH